jgi:hypothetical protein
MFRKKHFSTFWFLILILAVIWFLSELGYIDVNVPWLPLILIVIAMGAFINHLIGK